MHPTTIDCLLLSVYLSDNYSLTNYYFYFVQCILLPISIGKKEVGHIITYYIYIGSIKYHTAPGFQQQSSRSQKYTSTSEKTLRRGSEFDDGKEPHRTSNYTTSAWSYLGLHLLWRIKIFIDLKKV